MSTIVEAVVTNFPQYTEHPSQGPGTVYPNHGFQLLSTTVTLVGLTVLTYCFARRSDYEGVWTFRGLRDLPWARLCVMLIFLDSWAFIFCSGLLIHGAGLSADVTHCSLAIFSCIFLYAISKLLIYLFLIEKVYIVWAPYGSGKATARLKTPVFIACMCMLAPLFLILGVLIWGRIAVLRSDDQVCVIGLRRAASLSLLCYDLFMTVVLTSLFVWPLFTGKVGIRLRKVASRTLIASLVALTTSCINVVVLTLLHGKELGWVCLGSCGTDVTINAIAIYWVTDGCQAPRLLKETPPTSGVTGHSTKSADNIHSPAMRPSLYLGPNSINDASVVPAGVVSGRTTRFASSLRSVSVIGGDGTSAPSSSTRRIDGGRNGGWFSAFFSAIRGSDQRGPEEHTMSIQVTVTTEHPIHGESKYPPSEVSHDDLEYTREDYMAKASPV
ncbi:hypothetical protein FRB94_006455 [Tulasnella sp. JGI-2019a]|nr:hypothetical protein FRB94_006455 [Tulasnella sp. JGI-2019a]KAG9027061.1 hypothetical protein FRB95_008162 [Tulasnella sp. JGI-2019a]